MTRRGSEGDTVRAFERLFGGPSARRAAVVGIGDDAAVLAGGPDYLVWTVDTSVQNVHFRLDWLSPGEIGARAFHAAVSDIAAMGARPAAALSSLVVPDSMTAAALRDLARGQARAAKELRCPIVGGNLSRGRELSVTTTVVGRTRRPLLRSGARPGDELWLVGDIGLARAGLLLLSKTRRRSRPRVKAADRRAVARAVTAWRRARARVREGERLARYAHCAIDISDGLAADAAHIAEASRVRIVIEESPLRSALPRDLARLGALLGADPLELALTGGEDYALLATGPGSSRPRGARAIGRVERGRGVLLDSGNEVRRIQEPGFDHFERGGAGGQSAS